MGDRLFLLTILVLSGCGEAVSPTTKAVAAATNAPVPAADSSAADRARERDRTLLQAAERGDTATLESLLRSGVAPDTVGADGRTPLLLAAREGHRPTAETLLKAGAKVDARGPDGRTALHAAVERDDDALAGALVRAGANPATADLHGCAPLDLAAARGLTSLVESWKGASTQVELARLIRACRKGDDAYIKALPAAAPCAAQLNTDGNSALHWAAATGHETVVKALLEKRIPSDLQDVAGRTPLLRAAAEGRVEAVQALLKGGADPTARGRDGLDAFCLAVDHDGKDVLDVLRWSGPGAKTALEAALIRAVETHRQPMLEHLLALGVDPGARNSRGRPALVLAAALGDAGFLHPLLEHGANANLADADGRTALMEAAGHPHASQWQASEAVGMLLGAGADPAARDKSGRTALQEAAARGNSEVIDRLRRAGAKD